jgi:quercetin dioxygenase-like cupin family protein
MTNETWITMFPGVSRRTITAGANIMQMLVRLEKGSTVPLHQHHNEQTTYMLSGSLRFTIGDRTDDIHAGETATIPGNVPHMVVALEDTLVVDTFSPPRDDLLAIDAQHGLSLPRR